MLAFTGLLNVQLPADTVFSDAERSEETRRETAEFVLMPNVCVHFERSERKAVSRCVSAPQPHQTRRKGPNPRGKGFGPAYVNA
jgi:hypothetical protein